MSQPRIYSLIESVANVAIGFGVALGTQIVVFPIFGLHATIGDQLGIAAVFTVVSIARSYMVRRLFNRIRHA